VFDWDMTATDLTEGLGGFFTRFPAPTLDMPVSTATNTLPGVGLAALAGRARRRR